MELDHPVSLYKRIEQQLHARQVTVITCEVPPEYRVVLESQPIGSDAADHIANYLGQNQSSILKRCSSSKDALSFAEYAVADLHDKGWQFASPWVIS